MRFSIILYSPAHKLMVGRYLGCSFLASKDVVFDLLANFSEQTSHPYTGLQKHEMISFSKLQLVSWPFNASSVSILLLLCTRNRLLAFTVRFEDKRSIVLMSVERLSVCRMHGTWSCLCHCYCHSSFFWSGHDFDWHCFTLWLGLAGRVRLNCNYT